MSTSETKPRENRRKKTRYAVSEDCRLRSALTLWGEGSGGAKKDWPGTLVDLSSNGAHVQISLAAVAYPGDNCRLKLGFGATKIEIPGVLAHYVCAARHSVCGMSFDFSYPGVEKAYQRIFEVVVASASLTAGPAGTDAMGRHREEYRGANSARLLVWREKLGGAVTGFEYIMSGYAAVLPEVEGDAARMKELIRFKPVSPADASDSPSFLSKAQEADARWEFAIAASNLPAAVPADLRKFFLALA
jgi:hypothetical protein